MSNRNVRAGGAFIEVSLVNRLARGAKGIQSDLDKIGKQVAARGSAIAKLGGVVAVATGGLLAYPISAASEMQETMGKFGVVFGESAKTVEAWADATAQAMGVSEQSMAMMLASMQDLLVPMGVLPDSATGMSKTLSALAVDLASFNNMDVGKTFDDMMAAMTGSGEVMKKYGVILDEAKVKQELFDMGLDPKNADDAAKAQARLAIIMRGTTAAQGDAIRTSSSFANSIKALRATFVDLSGLMGGAIIEDLAYFAALANGAGMSVKGFVQDNEQLVRILGLATLATGAAGVALIGLGGSIVVGGMALGGLATAVGFIVSPLGIATVAMGAFGYAVIKYTSFAGDSIDWLSERFGPLVSTVQNAMGAITQAMSAGDMTTAWELTTDLMEMVWLDLTGSMQDAWGEAMGWLLDSGSATAEGIAQVFKALSATFGGMLDAYKSTYDAIYDFTSDKLNGLSGIETIGAPAPKTSAFEQQFSGQEATLRSAIDSIRQFGQNMSDEAQGQVADRMAERNAAKAEREARIAALRGSLNAAGSAANTAKTEDPKPDDKKPDRPDFESMLASLTKQAESPESISESKTDNSTPSNSAPTATFNAFAATIIGRSAGPADKMLTLTERIAASGDEMVKAIQSLSESLPGEVETTTKSITPDVIRGMIAKLPSDETPHGCDLEPLLKALMAPKQETLVTMAKAPTIQIEKEAAPALDVDATKVAKLLAPVMSRGERLSPRETVLKERLDMRSSEMQNRRTGWEAEMQSRRDNRSSSKANYEERRQQSIEQKRNANFDKYRPLDADPIGIVPEAFAQFFKQNQGMGAGQAMPSVMPSGINAEALATSVTQAIDNARQDFAPKQTIASAAVKDKGKDPQLASIDKGIKQSNKYLSKKFTAKFSR